MPFLRLENYEFSRLCYRNYITKILQKEGVGDRFILLDLVITYTSFGSSKPSVSLEITNIASLTRETSTIIPKKLLKKEFTYSSNTF